MGLSSIFYFYTRYISMYLFCRIFTYPWTIEFWIVLYFVKLKKGICKSISHRHSIEPSVPLNMTCRIVKKYEFYRRQGSLQTLSARDRPFGLKTCVLQDAILLQQYNNDFSASNNLILIASEVHACLSQVTIIYITSSRLVCLSFWSCLICWLWSSMHLIWWSMDEYGVELRNYLPRKHHPILYTILYYTLASALSPSVRSINIIDC